MLAWKHSPSVIRPPRQMMTGTTNYFSEASNLHRRGRTPAGGNGLVAELEARLGRQGWRRCSGRHATGAAPDAMQFSRDRVFNRWARGPWLPFQWGFLFGPLLFFTALVIHPLLALAYGLFTLLNALGPIHLTQTATLRLTDGLVEGSGPLSGPAWEAIQDIAHREGLRTRFTTPRVGLTPYALSLPRFQAALSRR